ncbi:hypothetical protein BJX63DRAFT_378422 [Aspergillus granulosus]|uniref:Uncharacterized protein n=1 Tax=Aspergillus granulosus TaxID=176169 RepID=A0ABR4I1L5_9EURO
MSSLLGCRPWRGLQRRISLSFECEAANWQWRIWSEWSYQNFFDEQSGNFELEIKSIAAYHKEEGRSCPYRDRDEHTECTSMGYNVGDKADMSSFDEKIIMKMNSNT